MKEFDIVFKLQAQRRLDESLNRDKDKLYACTECGKVFSTLEGANRCCGIEGCIPIQEGVKSFCNECYSTYKEGYSTSGKCIKCGGSLVECDYSKLDK